VLASEEPEAGTLLQGGRGSGTYGGSGTWSWQMGDVCFYCLSCMVVCLPQFPNSYLLMTALAPMPAVNEIMFVHGFENKMSLQHVSAKYY